MHQIDRRCQDCWRVPEGLSADYPGPCHHPSDLRDPALRQRWCGGAFDPEPGGAVVPASLRHRAFGDVHRQPRQDGRTGRPPLADRPLLADRRRDHRAEREPAVDRAFGLTLSRSFPKQEMSLATRKQYP